MTVDVPLAEIVIAVHDARRPVARAIGSVVGSEAAAAGAVRVTVVCHNIPRSAFDETIGRFADAPVRWVELADGIPSPAGPFNHGVAIAEATYVGVMGSDDRFDRGAIDSLVGHAAADAPDAVLYPIRHQDGRVMPNPLVRRGRSRRLDPVRDRLAYRTAPLALIRRDTIDRLGLGFSVGHRSGEDVEFSTRLWNLADRIDFHPSDPCYVIGADAEDRVTSTRQEVRDELGPFQELLDAPWVAALGPAQRLSIVVKTLRIHLVGSVVRNAAAGAIGTPEADAYRRLVGSGLRLAPGALAPLSRRDRAIVDPLLERAVDPDQLTAAGLARPTAGRVQRLLPRNLSYAMHREADLRRTLRYIGWPR
ncbi:glycosyltransferase [Agromyces sp. M3QZ16-3]|uniref:glycosyltransferase n=1 Tax=Agromyces sp. M3QZ16-3 TaxID=3447585 RepID=UPI003F694BE5